jgi:hypothetical protein
LKASKALEEKNKSSQKQHILNATKKVLEKKPRLLHIYA